MASARTRSILPSFISAARTFRPVGLIRSPMMTNGRSIETTTSRLREASLVSKTYPLRRVSSIFMTACSSACAPCD